MGLTNNNTYSVYNPLHHSQVSSNRECHLCKKELKEYEEIYFKRTNRAKIYHKNCWEKLLQK